MSYILVILFICAESFCFSFFRLQEIVRKINDHMEDLKFESEDLYSSEGAERWLRELDSKKSQWHTMPLFCGCQTRNPQYYICSTLNRYHCFLWPELNWLPGLHGELMRVGSKTWSLTVSCVFLLLENMVSFAGLPFISLSSSHAHGRMESDSCVCMHTCINFVDFMHIQMASLTRCLWIQTLGTQM